MNKKLIVLFLFCGFISVMFLFKGAELNKGPCVFCNPDVLKRQTFYEDDLVLALYTHKPIFPGHCLVIPKRCITRFEELSNEEMIQIKETIAKVNIAVRKVFNTRSYLVLQKNGVEVGQTEPHVHFHYIPRQSSNNLLAGKTMFMIKALFTIAGPISAQEMKDVVEKLHKEMLEIDKKDQRQAV